MVIKKILILITLLISGLFIASPPTHAANPYVIEEFESKIEIEKDTDLFVKERIEANFTSERHGIFRYIPLYHTNLGRTIKTPVDVISVVDEDENSYNYQVSTTGGNVRIRIGDPERFVRGKRTYIITYRIKNVIRDYEGNYELYWNIVGSGWDTQILNASVVVDSPHTTIEKANCFAGRVGTKESLCTAEVAGNAFFSQANTRLGPSEDLTIVLGLNKEGGLVYPSLFTRTWWFISANWTYLFSVLPLVLIFYVWNKRGRDKRYTSENIYYKPDNVETKTVSLFSRKHLPLVYHPIDGLSPAEVGTIIDERVQTHDIIAEIMELARLGYIRIEKLGKKEFAFTKEKDFTDENLEGLKSYQKRLLKELFRKPNVTKSIAKAEKLFKDKSELKSVQKRLVEGRYVLLSALKNDFYVVLSDLRDDLYERMQEEGFFAGNPEKTRIKWLVIYAIWTAVSAFGILNYATVTNNPFPVIALVLLSSFGGFLAWFMPRRTPKGYSLYRQIEGLRDYLKKGKWRYEHMETNLFIEEILPLAISLQVVDRLADDMKAMEVKTPKYVGGVSAKTFNIYISDFYSQASSDLFTSPKSSSSGWSGGSGFSGGSSGGGFGGGGGGSW